MDRIIETETEPISLQAKLINAINASPNHLLVKIWHDPNIRRAHILISAQK